MNDKAHIPRRWRADAQFSPYRPQACRRHLSILFAAMLLCSSCVSTVTETPYNLGVAAWQKKNYHEAARQWSVAVQSGDLNAMNNLAYLNSNGMGVPRRDDVALRLWEAAAYAGHSEAQWHLGSAYEEGLGVSVDLVRAYAWYACAAESATRRVSGDAKDLESAIGKDAEASLTALKPKLDSQQLDRAERLRGQLIERYGKPVP